MAPLQVGIIQSTGSTVGMSSNVEMSDSESDHNTGLTLLQAEIERFIIQEWL